MEELVGIFLYGREVGLTVMRSVFDGGEGETREGRDERSRERGVLEPLEAGDEIGEVGGELCSSFMFIDAACPTLLKGKGRRCRLKDYSLDCEVRETYAVSRWRSILIR